MNADNEQDKDDEKDDAGSARGHADHGDDGETGRPGYFPIRVVSQRTGVNSVTLRAWERRYGLLKPVRTPKGHRLYSEEDVARVANILEWIDRGISIGRVRSLLERSASAAAVEAGPEPDTDPAAEPSDWQRYSARLLAASAAFDENRLDDTVNEALSLYPFATVCDRLLNPLEQSLHARCRSDAGVPGHAAEQVFFEGYLRRKLAARLQFDARTGGGAPVLIAALPGTLNMLALRTLAIGCIGMEVPVLLLEDALAVEELIVAADRRRPALLLLHGDDAQEPAAFSRYLQRLTAAGLTPLAVAGAAARIHEALLASAGVLALTDPSLASAVRRLPLSTNDAGGRS